jgi:hypothetical protein
MRSSSKVYTVHFFADEMDYYAKVQFDFSYDANYGADADGHRGMGVWLCKGAEVESIKDIFDNNIEEKDLSEEAKKDLEKEISDFDDWDDRDLWD